MDDKRKQRYVLAVYLIIALIAVVLYLLSTFSIKTGNIHDMMINLSSELIGVVILFFIVNQAFLLDKERELTDRLKETISLFERKFAVICTEKESLEQLEFPKRLEKAHSFDLMAIDASRLLKDHCDAIVRALGKEIHIRVILTDTRSDSARILEERVRKFESSFQLYDYGPILNLISSRAGKNIPGKFEVKIVNWIPSCRILAFDLADEENGALIANIYPIGYLRPDYHSRVSLFLTPNSDLQRYSQFKRQFNEVCSSAADWRETHML